MATVEGVVRLASGSSLALRELPQTRNQPPVPKQCRREGKEPAPPVSLEQGNGLRGVTVFATDFSGPTRDTSRRVHDVAIEKCAMTPSFVLASRGDVLRLHNNTDYPFLPKFGDTNLMRVILRDEQREIPLDFGGHSELRCGFAAPCGVTDVVVFYHRVFTKTAELGRYRLENVPAGQPVKLHAWHPLYRDTEVTLELRAGETRTVDFVVHPLTHEKAASGDSTES